MKKTITLLAIAAIVVACGISKPERTVENLKTAIIGERNASAAYAEFAQRAAADSLFNIAAMFRATSASEQVHADGHIKTLSELGVTFEPTIEPVKVGTTLENLTKAREGEDYELTIMYPKFIQEAGDEKADKAVTSFTYAMTAEGRHSIIYQAAVNAMVADGNDLNVSSEWAVCPVCGDTYHKSDLGSICDICGMSSDKFKMFSK